MRLAVLLLFVLPLGADTFTFSGSWENLVDDPGLPIAIGDPIEGSFTFDRDLDGRVSGELTYSLGGLTWEPFFFIEDSDDGEGFMALKSREPACESERLVSLPCAVMLGIGHPTSERGGNGTTGQGFVLAAVNPTSWYILGESTNIVIDPYIPFAVRELYFVPEPATFLLTGVGLLLALVRNVMSRSSIRT